MRQHTRSNSPETNPTAISIPKLRTALNGRVITPEDATYDEAHQERKARADLYGGRRG